MELITFKSTEKELSEIYKRYRLERWIPKLSKDETLVDLYDIICSDKSMMEELTEHLDNLQSKISKEYPNIWLGELK